MKSVFLFSHLKLKSLLLPNSRYGKRCLPFKKSGGRNSEQQMAKGQHAGAAVSEWHRLLTGPQKTGPAVAGATAQGEAIALGWSGG